MNDNEEALYIAILLSVCLASVTDFFVADGGGLQVLNLISLLQRHCLIIVSSRKKQFSSIFLQNLIFLCTNIFFQTFILSFRNLSKIILFCSSSVPLQPSSQWDPANESQPLSQNNIDFDIPSFFGVIPSDISDEEQRSYDLSHSQVRAWLAV